MEKKRMKSGDAERIGEEENIGGATISFLMVLLINISEASGATLCVVCLLGWPLRVAYISAKTDSLLLCDCLTVSRQF